MNKSLLASLALAAVLASGVVMAEEPATEAHEHPVLNHEMKHDGEVKHEERAEHREHRREERKEHRHERREHRREHMKEMKEHHEGMEMKQDAK